MTSASWRWWLAAAAVLAVALAARVAFVLSTAHFVPFLQDGFSYDTLARGLALGHGWVYGRSAYREPGYPFFLAFVYKIVGIPPALYVTGRHGHIVPNSPGALHDGWLPARLVEAVLATGTVALIGWFVTELSDRRTALVAMALGAVYLSLITVGVSLMTESLLVPLAMLSICCALRSRRSAHPLRWIAAAGLFDGLATLTHENALVIAIGLAPFLWLDRRRRDRTTDASPCAGRRRGGLVRSLVAPLLLLAVTALAISPWTVRNAITEHRFVLVSTELGPTLSGTYNNTAANHHFVWTTQSHYSTYAAIRRGPHRNDAAYNTRLTHAVVDYLGHHPTDVPRAMFWNTVRLLDLGGRTIAHHTAFPDVDADKNVDNWMIDSFWVIGLLALAGLCTRAVRRVPKVLWLIPLLLWLSEAWITTGTPRFRATLEPWFLLLASSALVALARAVVRAQRALRRRMRSPVPA